MTIGKRMISGVIAVLLLFLSPGTPLRSDFTRVSWNLGENFRVQSQYKYNRATKCMSTTLDEDPATDKSILTILDQSQNERTDQQKPKNLLSKDWELPNAIKDIRCYLSVNDSFVPVIGVHKASTFIKLRSYLFGQGVYPGVEYKILNITKFSSSDISDHSDSRDKSDGSKVTSSELSSLQGLLERGQRDKILFNDDSTGWIGRLFGGPMQLIQTGTSERDDIEKIQTRNEINRKKAIEDRDENMKIVSSDLSAYFPEENFIELTVKPAYPLIKELEKKWPVKVRLSAIPYVFSRGSYTTVTLLGTLSFAMGYLLGAILLTQLFSFSFINSRSMTPTILPGDLILIEKVSPIIRRALHIPQVKGDIVFFSAPPRLVEMIEESNSGSSVGGSSSNGGGNSRGSSRSSSKGADKNSAIVSADTNSKSNSPNTNSKNPFQYRNLKPITGNTLLVKRFQSFNVREPLPSFSSSSSSPSYTVLTNNKNSKNDENSETNRKNENRKTDLDEKIDADKTCLYVLGDNPEASFDSRNWGCLDEELVIGRPIIRVLPLNRIGFLK